MKHEHKGKQLITTKSCRRKFKEKMTTGRDSCHTVFLANGFVQHHRKRSSNVLLKS